MGEEANEQRWAWNREMTVTTNLSLDIDKNPRDLLQDFVSENGGGKTIHIGELDCEDESEIELNLGLSLGGRFGVDKTQRKLKRSSSILDIVPFNYSMVNEMAAEPENYTVGLARTTSLPSDIEEEWRKRKEMQSLRRMEAKTRCEKQNFRARNSDDQIVSFESGFLQRHLVSSNRQVCGFDSDGGGGSSSSLLELDNNNQQGSTNSCNDGRSPKVMTGRSSNSGSHGKEKARERKANKATEESVDRKGNMTTTTTGLLDMPCVFTKGDDPNANGLMGFYTSMGKVRK